MSFSGDVMQIKALIVGINNYIACNNLKYAVSDATSVKDLLESSCGPRNAILMVDGSEPKFTPLGSNIATYIKILSETADEKDNIFFYFAGHAKDIGGEPSLLPSDYREEIGLSSAIRIEDVKQQFVNSKAKFKLLILDSCHSGAVKGREESGLMSRSMFDAIDKVPEGFAIVSACGLNQISYEDDELKHGVFTYYLLEGLKGKADTNRDNMVSVHELYDYVTPRVKEWIFKQHKTSQIPHIRSNFSDVYNVLILPKTPPEETVETFGTNMFYYILLETESQEMEWLEFESRSVKPEIEDAIEGTIKNTLLVLRKGYGMGGLKDDGREISFSDGKVLRNVETDDHRNEARFSVQVHFKYNNKIWSKIDNLMLELDDMNSTWEKVEFTTKKKFDFTKIEKSCDTKGYRIDDISVKKPEKITFQTDFFYDTLNDVTVVQLEDYCDISISSANSTYLKEHFYTIINPKKVSELLGSLVT